MTKLRIAALIAAVSCIGIFVAGCGDSSSTTPDATTPPAGGTKGGDKMGTDTKAPAAGAPATAPAAGGDKMATPPGPKGK